MMVWLPMVLLVCVFAAIFVMVAADPEAKSDHKSDARQ